MSRVVERDLESLRALGLRMGGLAEAILLKSLEALVHGSADLADEVQKDDLEIDRLDVQIDEAVLETLATQAPLAQDLRWVIGVKSLATDLERVGDLARNIAKSAHRLADRTSVPIPAKLEDLADQTRRQLRLSLDAFAHCDGQRAREVLRGDDAVDDTQDVVVEQSLESLQANPEFARQEVDLILVAKSLERVADHATNIAEETIRIAESRNLKHAEKLDT